MTHRLALGSLSFLTLTALAYASLACLVGGCGGGSSTSGNDTGAVTSAVSFRADIAPVFVKSCATDSGCHGAADGSNVYLAGPPADSTRVLGLLVNKPSLELAVMPYITPGDPTESFLMHKLDGDLPSLSACASSNICGSSMPKDQPSLDQATRDKIRNWIKQGAKDD
jgi:hypothetical protein